MKKQNGLGLLEVVIGMSLLGMFSFLAMQIFKNQVQQRKIAEIKTSLNLLHTRAQQAVRKYQFSTDFEEHFKAGSNLEKCFKSQGDASLDCEKVETTFSGFKNLPPTAYGTAMNKMMNGDYGLLGEENCGARCPVQVRTIWDFDCTPISCKSIKFFTEVSVEDGLLSSGEEKALMSSMATLSSESIYQRSKSVGLVRSLSSFCEAPSGVNFGTGLMECPSTAPSGTNKVFNTNLGNSFQNSGMLLAGGGPPPVTTTGGDTGDDPSLCPDGSVAQPDGSGKLACPTVILCTKPGWVTRGNKCCDPRIPDAGDGWGPWGDCSIECGKGGVRKRSCLYPKEEYCDSLCSRDQGDTEPCDGKDYALNEGWGAWEACKPNCGDGTKTRTCVQDKLEFCSSKCSLGQSESLPCNSGACCVANPNTTHVDSISRTWPGEMNGERGISACWSGFPSNWCNSWADGNCCGRGARASMTRNKNNKADCEPLCTCN